MCMGGILIYYVHACTSWQHHNYTQKKPFVCTHCDLTVVAKLHCIYYTQIYIHMYVAYTLLAITVRGSVGTHVFLPTLAYTGECTHMYMYMYIHTCIYCIYMYIHVHVHVYTYVYIHVYTCTCMRLAI